MLLPLPIDPLLPAIVAALVQHRRLVLVAPPGSGKTTRVPRALLDAGFGDHGQIVVLEPRRLAARLAAERVAEELGERVGERVGYRVREDDATSAATRIVFVTEGVLTRRLVTDRDLVGVSVVLLDEVHERHLASDLALAELRALRLGSRPDLAVIAMSATLEAAPIARFLDAPIIEGQGRPYDVVIEHEPQVDDRPLPLRVASAVRRLCREERDGHVLVFLPGAAEIRKAKEACEAIATEHRLALHVLHGDLGADEQNRAVRDSEARKVILATNVAESSVTIPGVGAVVDAGTARILVNSPWTGFSSLRVEKVSRASATQRAGRAGRTRHGRALRLYPQADFDARPAHDAPEIHRIDLAEMVLELRARGVDPRAMAWLEAPKDAAIAAADELLSRLGAIDAKGAITELGRRMLRIAVHPRLARLWVHADDAGLGREGAKLAALLSERDVRASSRARFGPGARGPSRSTDSDVLDRLDDFDETVGSGFSSWVAREAEIDVGAARSTKRLADRFARLSRSSRDVGPEVRDETLRRALLLAFPDRVARRRKAGGRELVLSSGSALLAEESGVTDAPFVVVVDAREAAGARAPLATIASAVEAEWLLEYFPDRVRDESEVTWDAERERVLLRDRLLYDDLVIDESTKAAPAGDPRGTRALVLAAMAKGPAAYTSAPEKLERLVARGRFLRGSDASFPDFDDLVRQALEDAAAGSTRLAELAEIDVAELLVATLPSALRQRLDRDAPDTVALPSGRSAIVSYEPGKPPFIESRLQDFYGWRTGPTVAGGVPLVLHLLAPNKRAVQVTTDLEGFWTRTYPAIKKELARKYPRHAWPDDPFVATPPMRPRTR